MPEDTPSTETPLVEDTRSLAEKLAERRAELSGGATSKEEALETTTRKFEETTAKEAAVVSRTKEIEDLDVGMLLHGVSAGREMVLQGPVEAGYESPDSILEMHAKRVGMTPMEYRGKLAKHGYGWEWMSDAVGREGKSVDEVLAEAKSRGTLGLMPEREREIRMRGESLREAAIEKFIEKGEPVPDAYWDDSFVISGTRNAIIGMDADEEGMADMFSGGEQDKILSRAGEKGYVKAQLESDMLLALPGVARLVTEYSGDFMGGEKYLRGDNSRVTRLAAEYSRINGKEASEAVVRALTLQAAHELATFKMVGVWHSPIFIRSDTIMPNERGTGDRTGVAALYDSFAPTVEIVGVDNQNKFVVREATAMSHIFDKADALQAGVVGAWKYGGWDASKWGEGALQGISENRNLLEASIETAADEDMGTFGMAALGGIGLLGMMYSPDLLFSAAGAPKLLKSTGDTALVLKGGPQAAKALTKMLEAHKAGNPDLFADLSRDFALKYKPAAEQIDSLTVGLSSLMAKQNPDIAGPEGAKLADMLPGKAGEQRVNIAPTQTKVEAKLSTKTRAEKGEKPLRKGEVPKRAKPVEETPIVTPELYNFRRQREIVKAERDAIELHGVNDVHFKGQLHRATVAQGSELINIVEKSTEVGSKAAQDHHRQLRDSLGEAMRDPDAWYAKQEDLLRQEEAFGMHRTYAGDKKDALKAIDDQVAAGALTKKAGKAAKKQIKDAAKARASAFAQLRKIKDEAAKRKKELPNKKDLLAALDRADKAIDTNVETRAAATYIFYSSLMDAQNPFGKKWFGVGKKRTDLLNKTLLDDLEAYKDLSEHARNFAKKATVLEKISRREALNAAGWLEARARNAARRKGITVSEWWETRVKGIETEEDLQKIIDDAGGGSSKGGGKGTKVVDEADDTKVVDEADDTTVVDDIEEIDVVDPPKDKTSEEARSSISQGISELLDLIDPLEKYKADFGVGNFFMKTEIQKLENYWNPVSGILHPLAKDLESFTQQVKTAIKDNRIDLDEVLDDTAEVSEALSARQRIDRVLKEMDEDIPTLLDAVEPPTKPVAAAEELGLPPAKPLPKPPKGMPKANKKGFGRLALPPIPFEKENKFLAEIGDDIYLLDDFWEKGKHAEELAFANVLALQINGVFKQSPADLRPLRKKGGQIYAAIRHPDGEKILRKDFPEELQEDLRQYEEALEYVTDAKVRAEKRGLSPRQLYDHLVQFDARVNPDARLTDVVQWLYDYGGNAGCRAICRRLIQSGQVDGTARFFILNGSGDLSIGKLNAYLLSKGQGKVDTKPSSFQGLASAASPGEFSWNIARGSGYGSTGLNEETLVHELLHNVTSDVLYQGLAWGRGTPAFKKAAKELDDFAVQIYNIAEKEFKRLKAKTGKTSDEWQRYYTAKMLLKKSVLGSQKKEFPNWRFSRSTELISYGMTDPATQKFLRSIPIEEVLKAGEQPRSMLDKFVELIGRLFSPGGRKLPAVEENAWHRAILLSEDMIAATTTQATFVEKAAGIKGAHVEWSGSGVGTSQFIDRLNEGGADVFEEFRTFRKGLNDFIGAALQPHIGFFVREGVQVPPSDLQLAKLRKKIDEYEADLPKVLEKIDAAAEDLAKTKVEKGVFGKNLKDIEYSIALRTEGSAVRKSADEGFVYPKKYAKLTQTELEDLAVSLRKTFEERPKKGNDAIRRAAMEELMDLPFIDGLGSSAGNIRYHSIGRDENYWEMYNLPKTATLQEAADTHLKALKEQRKGTKALADKALADETASLKEQLTNAIEAEHAAFRDFAEALRKDDPFAGAIYDAAGAPSASATRDFPQVTGERGPLVKTDIDTPEFENWSRGTKVVDEAGEPLVVYHGSRRSRGFEAFDPTKRGSALDTGFLGEGFYFSTKPDTAAYYAGVGRAPRNMDEIVETSGFVPVGREGSIVPTYLSLKNPYDFGTKTQGVRGLVMRGDRLPDDIHDAVVKRAGFEFDPDLAKADYSASVTQPLERDLSRAMREVLTERGYDGVIARIGDELEIVAFEPTQIKSVYNRGTWDPAVPDINLSAVREDPRVVDHAGPFYSALERRAQHLPRKMQIDAVIPWLRKQPGVKGEEIEYTYMDLFIEDMKAQGKTHLNADEVVDYLQKNQVEIQEITPGQMSKARKAAEKANSEAYKPVEALMNEAGVAPARQHWVYGNPNHLLDSASVFLEDVTRTSSSKIDVLESLLRRRTTALQRLRLVGASSKEIGITVVDLLGSIDRSALPEKLKIPFGDYVKVRFGHAIDSHQAVMSLGSVLMENPEVYEELVKLSGDLSASLVRAKDSADSLSDIVKLSNVSDHDYIAFMNGQLSGAQLKAHYDKVRTDVNRILDESTLVGDELADIDALLDLDTPRIQEQLAFYDKTRKIVQTPEWRAWTNILGPRERLREIKNSEPEGMGPHYSRFVSGNAPIGKEQNYREILIQTPSVEKKLEKAKRKLYFRQKAEKHRQLLAEEDELMATSRSLPPGSQEWLEVRERIGIIQDNIEDLEAWSDIYEADWRRTPKEAAIDEELETLVANYAEEGIGDASDALSAIQAKYPGYWPPLGPDSYVSHNWDEATAGIPGGYLDVVTHIRTRDISDPEGKKVLLVEEIQSDWHQEGRVQGYSKEENEALRAKYFKTFESVQKELRDLAESFDVRLAEGSTISYVPTFPDGTYAASRGIGIRHIEKMRTGGFRLDHTSGTVKSFDSLSELKSYVRQDIFKTLDNYWPSTRSATFFENPVVKDIIERRHSVKRKLQQNERGHVPDAPFKKNWPALAVKRILHLAAEEGYDSVAFTKGDVIQGVSGGELAGQRYFYDKVLPKVVAKEAKQVGGQVTRRTDLDFGKLENKLYISHFNSWDGGVVTVKLTEDVSDEILQGRPLFQKRVENGVEVEKASVSFLEDGRAVVRALEQPDFSSLVHEIGHIIRRDMDPEELDEYMFWLKGEPHKLNVEVEGSRLVGTDAEKAEELFASAFEAYLRDGIAPTKGMVKVFEDAKRFLVTIYATLAKDDRNKIQVVPEVSAILDKMLGEVPSHNTGFHRLSKALKDEVIGPNSGLGEVSVAARMAEEIRRILPKGESIITEEELLRRIKKVEDKVNTDNATTFDEVAIELPFPIFHNKFEDGKDTFTLREIINLQETLEAERFQALRQSLPEAYTETKVKAVTEMDPADRIMNMLSGPGWSRQLGRAWMSTLFGGDSQKIGQKSMRVFPPLLRSDIHAGGRVIEQAYGETVRLVGEGDWDKIEDYLTGELTTFKFGGRQLFSSGHDAAEGTYELIRRVADELKPEELTSLREMFEFTTPWKMEKNTGNIADRAFDDVYPTVAGTEALNAQRAWTAIDKLLNSNGTSLFMTDLAGALGMTGKPTSQQFRFIEGLLYAAGVTTRKDAFIEMASEGASKAALKGLFEDTASAFGSKSGKMNRSRLAILMAGHGQVNRIYNKWSVQGLAIKEDVKIAFLNWSNGEKVADELLPEVQEVTKRYGLNAHFFEEPVLDSGYFLPEIARDRLAEALARGKEKAWDIGDALTKSERDMGNVFGGFYRYMKLRMTRGAFAVRQRYFFMNTIDHFSQMAMITGMRPAVVSTIRVVAQDVMVIPGIARTLGLLEVTGIKPHAMEKVRRALQKGGDKAARAVGKLLRVSKYRLDLNGILDGSTKTVRMGNRTYDARAIRDIMVEEGIFASFDTTQLANVIRKSATGGARKWEIPFGLESKWARVEPVVSTVGEKAEELFLKTVTETAEAWAERERAGAMLTLMEMGMSPRAAARTTIDALYDYAGSMSKMDRAWFMSLLFPFWAFQKNANKQVINLLFSPAGVYRMGVIRRAEEGIPELFAALMWEQLTGEDPYGIYDVESLPPEVQDQYYIFRDRLENGYGPIGDLSGADKQRLLNAFNGRTIDKMTDAEISVIENGYGSPENMPKELRLAIRQLFIAGHKLGSFKSDGKAYQGSEFLAKYAGFKDEGGQAIVNELRDYAIPRPDRSGRASYLRERAGIPVPPIMTENVRKYYSHSRSAGTDNPYTEFLLPDSTIKAGMRHTANMIAFTILAADDLGVDLGMMTDEEAGGAAIMPSVPFEEVLRVRDTPIPGLFLDMVTEPSLQYPRRIHPAIASRVENVFNLRLLRISALENENDPFQEDIEASGDEERREHGAFGDEERKIQTVEEKYINEGGLLLTEEKVYMMPGVWRLLFENSPLGELNRIMMTMPTNIPLVDTGVTAGEGAEFRTGWEQALDPEQLIQWARFVTGVPTAEVRPHRAARLESRRVPEKLK